MSKDRPILLRGEMVAAILQGRKTQTRRIIQSNSKICGLGSAEEWAARLAENFHGITEQQIQEKADKIRPIHHSFRAEDGSLFALQCPYGNPGDRLWVRETWKPDTTDDDVPGEPGVCTIHYRADGCHIPIEDSLKAADQWLSVRRPEEQYPELKPPKWRSSIHMPRWASRLTLEVTNVRVERLCEITNVNAVKEGVYLTREHDEDDRCPRELFAALWNSINGKGSWNENPWVWVIEFRRVAQ